MKKISLLAIPLAALAILPGCIQDVNQSPELTGIGDINCLVNTTVDLLDGVSALDTEDGDITPDIDITIIPQTEVNGGYAVFREAGTYELIYEVEDSQGKTFRTTAYAEVSDRDVFMDSATTNGFSLTTGGHDTVEREGLNGSEYASNVDKLALENERLRAANGGAAGQAPAPQTTEKGVNENEDEPEDPDSGNEPDAGVQNAGRRGK